MNVARHTLDRSKVVKFLAAVVMGFSVGSVLSPDQVALPVVGATSSVAVGGVGLVVGALLYARAPGNSTCGCSADCDC